jgi:hypothetical protein
MLDQTTAFFWRYRTPLYLVALVFATYRVFTSPYIILNTFEKGVLLAGFFTALYWAYTLGLKDQSQGKSAQQVTEFFNAAGERVLSPQAARKAMTRDQLIKEIERKEAEIAMQQAINESMRATTQRHAAEAYWRAQQHEAPTVEFIAGREDHKTLELPSINS